MKKLLSCLFLTLLAVAGVRAQDTKENARKLDSLQQVVSELSSKVKTSEEDKRNEAIWKNRKKYFNIGYVTQTLTHENIKGLEWESDLGVFLAYGRTFYLHKKPLFKMIKFGLDLTLPDITYVKYSTPSVFDNEEDYDGEDMDLGVHQVDIGAHIGPSITVNPVDHLKISAHFRFAPSASVVILNDEVNTQFVPYLVFGGAVAYKAISLGIETRQGSAEYKSFSADEDAVGEDEGTGNIDDIFISDKNKLKTKSVRFYISFRF